MPENERMRELRERVLADEYEPVEKSEVLETPLGRVRANRSNFERATAERAEFFAKLEKPASVKVWKGGKSGD